MPFATEEGLVASLLEHGRHGRSAQRKGWFIRGGEGMASKPAGQATGEAGDTGGRALGHHIVLVKTRPRCRQGVQVRRVSPCWVVVANISPALIVSDDHHNIRPQFGSREVCQDQSSAAGYQADPTEEPEQMRATWGDATRRESAVTREPHKRAFGA